MPWVDHQLALLLGRDDPLHVLVDQFHVADGGLHQAGLLLHAFGGHLEARGQFFGRNQVVSVHPALLGLQVRDQLVGRRLVVVQLIHHAQALVLAQAKAVIGQELVVDHVLVGADERQDRPDVLLVGVDAGNQRRAGDEVDVGKGLVGLLDVRQDRARCSRRSTSCAAPGWSACGRGAPYRRGAAPFRRKTRAR